MDLIQGVPKLSLKSDRFVRSVLTIEQEGRQKLHLGMSDDYDSVSNQLTFGYKTGFMGSVKEGEMSLDALQRHARLCGNVELVNPQLAAIVDYVIEQRKGHVVRVEAYRCHDYQGCLQEGRMMHEHDWYDVNELPFEQMLPGESPPHGWLMKLLTSTQGDRTIDYVRFVVSDISLRRAQHEQPTVVSTFSLAPVAT